MGIETNDHLPCKYSPAESARKHPPCNGSSETYVFFIMWLKLEIPSLTIFWFVWKRMPRRFYTPMSCLKPTSACYTNHIYIFAAEIKQDCLRGKCWVGGGEAGHAPYLGRLECLPASWSGWGSSPLQILKLAKALEYLHGTRGWHDQGGSSTQYILKPPAQQAIIPHANC